MTRIEELERAITRAWLLLGGSGSPNTALAFLPAGGLWCERMVEIARDELGAVLGKDAGFRGTETDDQDEMDDVAAEIMSEADPRPILKLVTRGTNNE